MLFYSHDGVGWEPDILISMAIENTRLLGNVILKALKEGEALEAISRKTEEYVASRLGSEIDEPHLAATVSRYILYFKMKRLA